MHYTRTVTANLRTTAALMAAAIVCAGPVAGPVALAQEWDAGVNVPDVSGGNTTEITRTAPPADAAAGEGQVRLVAMLTADGQVIDQGLVWRVFASSEGSAGKSKLVAEKREAAPTIALAAGKYTINAAFGRANLTRAVTVKPGGPAVEQFVLNAGGLRVKAMIGTIAAPTNTAQYSIFSDDREQVSGRMPILTGAKPGLIVRLNAGIYRVVSTYGDSNATVTSDVTVEAGKLTEMTVTHRAGRVTFALVQKPGGDAQPDTQWIIQTRKGDKVRESIGALPTHILLPGDYTVLAKSGGQVFQRDFDVADGEMQRIEVLLSDAPSPE